MNKKDLLFYIVYIIDFCFIFFLIGVIFTECFQIFVDAFDKKIFDGLYYVLQIHRVVLNRPFNFFKELYLNVNNLILTQSYKVFL